MGLQVGFETYLGMYSQDNESESAMTVGNTSLEALKTIAFPPNMKQGEVVTICAGGRVLAATGGSARNIRFSIGPSIHQVPSNANDFVWSMVCRTVKTSIGFTSVIKWMSGRNDVETADDDHEVARYTVGIGSNVQIAGQDLNSEDTVTCDHLYITFSNE